MVCIHVDGRRAHMRKYITRDINVVAHKIQEALQCDWKFAFNITILHGPDAIDPFVSGQWQSDDARVLADHFWGLHRAYKEVSDEGRSITMYRAARSIYDKIHAKGTCGLSALNAPGLGVSVAKEAFDFYIAGTAAQLTDRSRKLILSGHANTYA